MSAQLTSHALETLLGLRRLPHLELALASGADEIDARGYARFVPERWEPDDGGGWSVTASFGPLATPASFDRVLLLADGEELAEQRLGSAASVPAGAIYETALAVRPPDRVTVEAGRASASSTVKAGRTSVTVR